MNFLLTCVILPLLRSVMLDAVFSEVITKYHFDPEDCRYLEFKPTKAFDGQRLINHVIQINDVKDRVLCKIRCFMEPNCVSYNLLKQPSGDNETHKCELNDVTHQGNIDDLVGEYDSFYHGSESNCIANPCKNNATCQSGFTDKGYRCLCSAGFKGQICDEDINECATEEQSCSVDAVCNNTKGSYDCKCKPGFSGNGWTCKDIDECATQDHGCSIYALCRDTRGSHNCKCKPGYSGDGRTCQDIDECATGNQSCSADAVCYNAEGSYNCSCKPGYSGDGWYCKDIDECATQDHGCSIHAVCRNTEGSHNCTCKPGYSWDGRTCQDIDECATGTHSCSADAECDNIKGSHNCQCKSGYSGNGHTCTDSDECLTGTHNCSADALCNNTKGSHNCTCKPGYSGNGQICKAVVFSSCKEAYDGKLLNVSNVVTLRIDSKPISVFCHVGNVGCGDGTWTLVMKINGSMQTFHYDSDYWSNKEEYNLPGGETGFDQMETKLPTYWNTSFSKICLGMKIDQQLRFIVINKQADSLHSLIADEQYRPIYLGRDKWRSLIGPKASSQIYCNREGFNLYPLTAFWEFKAPKARIGFVTNNADNCNDVNTRIGFGTGGPHDDSNTCGIVADGSGLDNGKQFIKAMGYILVQ